MTAAVDMLAAVRALGGEVKLVNYGRLKVIAPAPLPKELIEQLRVAKSDLLTLLASAEPQTEPCDSWAEPRRNAPRSWSMMEARRALGLKALRGSLPMHRLTCRRNVVRFIADCGRFLDCGWALKAAQFGWGPLDLFGCDRERPFARVDHLGLLWLLKGGTIVELHRDRAWSASSLSN
jgi:hypothetical protein